MDVDRKNFALLFGALNGLQIVYSMFIIFSDNSL